MLSRVANSLYWLSRHLERAENLARLVDVCRYDALDQSHVHGEDGQLWRALLYATCSEDTFEAARELSGGTLDVTWFITFSRDNDDSIRKLFAQARENARMVRDQISEEMWLELNSIHLFMQSQDAEVLWRNQPESFYRKAIKFCMLFSGLTGATILRDEGWQFIQVGKHIERADKTTRVLDMLVYEGNPDPSRLASALRSCSGFSAFHAEFRGELTLENVIAFLLFSESFPRSVRFCIRELDTHLHAISGTREGGFFNEAERLTGSLLAQLNYSSVDNVRAAGHHQYIDDLQRQFNEVGQQVFETYVLLPSEIRNLALQQWQWQWQQQQQQQ